MISKSSLIWLLMVISCSYGASRYKRTGLGSLLSISQSTPPEQPRYPVWKVHRYSGVQLLPLEVPPNTVEPEAPSAVDLPDFANSGIDEGFGEEEEQESSGGLGLSTLLSLFPGGFGGLLRLSQGSTRAEERLGYALKSDILSAILAKKKELAVALAKDAFGLALRKGLAVKSYLLGALVGQGHGGPGVYYNVPYTYPKRSSFLSSLPLIGHIFGGGGEGLQLPEVQIPSVPGLIAVPDPPQLPIINLPGKYDFPHRTGAYVKVDFPRREDKPQEPSNADTPQAPSNPNYPIPSTSYGVPSVPISVPEQPPAYLSENFFVKEPTTTSKPEVVTPQVLTYPSEINYPFPSQQFVPYPPDSLPYPQDSYASSSKDLYETYAHPMNPSPVYKRSMKFEKAPEIELYRKDQVGEEPTPAEDKDQVEDKRETSENK